MTTAHRPTYHTAVAVGSSSDRGRYTAGGQISTQFSSKDQPGQLTMKTRQLGQGSKDEMSSRDLKAELERKERFAREKRDGDSTAFRLDEDDGDGGTRDKGRAGILALLNDPSLQAFNDDDDDDDDNDDIDKVVEEDGNGEKGSESLVDDHAVDNDMEDHNVRIDQNDSSSFKTTNAYHYSDNDSDSDDSDDEEELMRELSRIKEERKHQEEVEKMKKIHEAEEARRTANLVGNPLLKINAESTGKTMSTQATMKRRWDDDVVFRVKDEPKLKKRFVNDTIRSDFHKRFLNKYIR